MTMLESHNLRMSTTVYIVVQPAGQYRNINQHNREKPLINSAGTFTRHNGQQKIYHFKLIFPPKYQVYPTIIQLTSAK